MELLAVEIAGTGSYLPGDPIPNDQIESTLGHLTEAPAPVQRFVQEVGPRMLARSGVRSRHFAVDPGTKRLTHTFSSLAEQACRRALEAAGMEPDEIELLVLSCPFSDYATPPTSAILQERLGIQRCAEFEIHSNCTGVGKAVDCAFNALRCGQYKTALVVYSQLSSLYLRSDYFNQPKMNKVHATLRWILADGAGAMVLRANPSSNGHPAPRILGTFVESVGASQLPGMTAGAAGVDLSSDGGPYADMYEHGRHHLWQDFAAVNEGAGPLLLGGMMRFLQKLQIEPSSVDHYVASVPTFKLYEANVSFFESHFGASPEKARFRSGEVGYCGGASTLIHLDDMVRGGEILPGQTVLVHAVESSKWMTAGFVARW